ncbi:MAG: F0F1 ATP synthase subunit A [Puniceicoccales bacterium]|jgi:F-type H+-transporting ATPase subunit a|nr:F0F1 ATP synthase subunit A [Puniceicoccales bacterium]
MFFTPLSAFPAESHGVPTSASEVLHFGSFAVTNSMIMTWLVTLAILAGAKIFIGRPQLVPSRAQAVVEELLCSLKDLLAPIVGKRVISAAFPLLVSFFVYILLMNWSGLIPGVGNIGAWVGEGEGRHFQDFFRPANSDLNTTLALALISFAGWIYFVLRYAGLRAFVRETFGNKATRSEVPLPLYLLLTVVFLAVGVIEMISIAFRPVSLSLRLYGNVFGGENLLHHLGGILPYVLPVAGYFLEVLVGLIQALVFTMLSAVYIGLVCNHSDEHAGETHA